MDVFVNHVRNGHLQEVTAQLDADPDYIDTPTSDNRRPLHYAAWGGHADMVTLLFNRGAQSLMTPDNHGSLPIHFAAQSGSIPCIDAILNRMREENLVVADVLAMPGSKLQTPIMFAFENRRIDAVRHLRELCPAAYNAITYDCAWIAPMDGFALLRVFDVALHVWDTEHVRLFVEHRQYLVLKVAFKHGDLSLIARMLERVPLSTIPPETALFYISENIGKNNDCSHRIYEFRPFSSPQIERLVKKCASVTTASFQFLEEELDAFVKIGPETMTVVMGLCVRSGSIRMFDLLYPRGVARYGWTWVRKTFLEYHDAKIQALPTSLYASSPEMWSRVVPILMSMTSDEFSRGQLYSLIVAPRMTSDEFSRGQLYSLIVAPRRLFRSLMNRPAYTVSQCIQLMNAVGGYGCAWEALHTPVGDCIQPTALAIHCAVMLNSVRTVRFLVGIGCELAPMPGWDQPHPCLELTEEPEMIDYIRALEGDVTIPEEKRMTVRYETYFEITLMWRLLHLI